MGTWGAGNLDSDYALDEVAARSKELIDTLFARARTKESREADEYDYTALFVDIETLLALAAKGLIEVRYLPQSSVVEELKEDYLRDWDAYIDELAPTGDFKKRRRQVIVTTFNRLKRLCAKRDGSE